MMNPRPNLGAACWLALRILWLELRARAVQIAGGSVDPLQPEADLLIARYEELYGELP